MPNCILNSKIRPRTVYSGEYSIQYVETRKFNPFSQSYTIKPLCDKFKSDQHLKTFYIYFKKLQLLSKWPEKEKEEEERAKESRAADLPRQDFSSPLDVSRDT